MTISEKITQFVVVICIAAIMTALGNIIDGKHLLGPSLVGVFVIAGLAIIGAIISYLPLANRLPPCQSCQVKHGLLHKQKK